MIEAIVISRKGELVDGTKIGWSLYDWTLGWLYLRLGGLYDPFGRK